MNDSLQQIARRFPLVARPRPACLPLKARIAEVRDLADATSQRTAPDHLTLAAQALNKAALIASDCGIPITARSLCWRHFTAYLPARPLGAREARHALEPLINLARLAIRDNDGTRAYQLLDTLFHAVSTGREADIDGRRVSFESFTRTADDLRTVLQWFWGVFLAEGTPGAHQRGPMASSGSPRRPVPGRRPAASGRPPSRHRGPLSRRPHRYRHVARGRQHVVPAVGTRGRGLPERAVQAGGRMLGR
ncbi:hypothetical protein [Nonomuraea harbinensis]|uniref:Uncharacterized protein n=1 Tax=Nonomuraea harbinensis TaxID=1286938 RepID=A0ABW1BLR1_9ACTN|nr:hypothetical protein [Nonomuraea harbinensis]